MTNYGYFFEVKKMLQNWSLKVVTAVITAAIMGCLVVFLFWTSPAGAMIFPDLLSLVRVDEDRVAADKAATGGENATDSGEKEQKAARAAEDKVIKESYIVKEGDTLWGLSRKYGVDWKKICYANSLNLNGVIRPGQKLTIPLEAGSFHVVGPGENLWEIARKYNTLVSDLVKANKLDDPNRLRVGTRLTIPEEKAAAPVFSPANSVRPDLASRFRGWWRWPVKGVITSVYGRRGDEFHHGLDLAAHKGERIYPVRQGKVEFAGWLNRIYGWTVIIDHGGGIRTLYAHTSKTLVEEGEKVETSTAIAKVGSSGRSTGPHLHLEVYVDGDTVDPQKLLK